MNLSAELLDGLAVILMCLALNSAMICAALVCRWHIQRKKGNLLPKKRLVIPVAGLVAGLALAATIFVLLYFWSLADMTLEYQRLPFLAGYIEVLFLTVVFVLLIRRWVVRRKTDNPSKKRWLVLECIGLLASLAAMVFYCVDFVDFSTWPYRRLAHPMMVLYCGAAATAIGVLLWLIFAKRRRVVKRIAASLTALGLVISLLGWPLYVTFDWAVLPWETWEYLTVAPHANTMEYAGNATHFYWLEDYEFLCRVPLEYPDSRPEYIPLPAVYDGKRLSWLRIAGLTEDVLYISAQYEIEREVAYEEGWEKQEHTQPPITFSVSGGMVTYADNEEGDRCRQVVYRVDLDSFEAEPVYDGWYTGPAWYHAATDSLLLIRTILDWTFVAQMDLSTGEKRLLFSGEHFFSDNESLEWIDLADGSTLLASANHPVDWGQNRILLDKDLEDCRTNYWFRVMQEPPQGFLAKRRLRNIDEIGAVAVCWNSIYFIENGGLYRMNSNGKGKTLLREDYQITELMNINEDLYCRVETAVPDFMGEDASSWSARYKSKTEWVTWLRLNQEGEIVDVLFSSNEGGCLRPFGEMVLVQPYWGWNGELSFYNPASHEMRRLGAGVDGDEILLEAPKSDYVFAQSYAKTPSYFYHLGRVYSINNEEYSEFTTVLRRVPLENLSKVEVISLPSHYKEHKLDFTICGVTEDALLLCDNYYSYDEEYIRKEFTVVYRVPHKTGRAELLLESERSGAAPWYNAAGDSLLLANETDGIVEIEALSLNTGEREPIFTGTGYLDIADRWWTLPDGRAALRLDKICVLVGEGNKVTLIGKDDMPSLAYGTMVEGNYDNGPICDRLEMDGKTYCLAYLWDGRIAGYGSDREIGFYVLDEFGNADKPLWRSDKSGNYGSHALVPLDGMVMVVTDDSFAVLYDPATGQMFSMQN